MTDDDRMIARTAIRQLMAVYNTSGDRGRIDELAATFAEDGALQTPDATFTGRPAIVAFLSAVSGGAVDGADLRGSRHHVTTSRIEFEGDDAAMGWSYFLVVRKGQPIQDGVYIDRFVRRDGRWLIAHRRIKLDWAG